MTTPGRDVFALLFILFLSLWIRVTYFQHTVIDTPVRGDAIFYLQYAKNLLNHATFSKETGSTSPAPDSYWAPGYPAFLAAVIVAADVLHVQAYPAIMALQVLLGALTAVLTFLIARLFLDRKWSLAAAVLAALSPHMVSLGANLLTETLYAFLLTASVYVFLLGFSRRSGVLYAASGAVFALAWLVNPVMFFLPLFFIAAALWFHARENGTPAGARRGMIVCLVLFLAIAGAWQARGILNVPPGSPSGADRLLTNLIIGSHSDYYRIWRADPRNDSNPASLDLQRLGGSYPAFAELLWQRIRQRPLHYLKWYFVDKPLLLWGWNIRVGQGDVYVFPVVRSWYQTSGPAAALHAVMKSLHFWLFALAILGLFVLVRRGARGRDTVPAFLYIVLVYVSAVYVVTQSEPRYSVPLRPEFYLCAVYFLGALTARLKGGRPGQPSRA